MGPSSNIYLYLPIVSDKNKYIIICIKLDISIKFCLIDQFKQEKKKNYFHVLQAQMHSFHRCQFSVLHMLIPCHYSPCEWHEWQKVQLNVKLPIPMYSSAPLHTFSRPTIRKVLLRPFLGQLKSLLTFPEQEMGQW